MVFCDNCGQETGPLHPLDGKLCCPHCGKVVAEDNFTEEPTFVKDAGGHSRMSGNYNNLQGELSSLSRERTLIDAKDGILGLMSTLNIDGGDSTADAATRFYRIAVERNFTRGRRRELVQAACLYIHCRVNKKPFLLIDFSEVLGVNVYVLGGVFLQLCQLLSLTEHEIVQKPVDPSLFIHRFTNGLFGNPDRDREVKKVSTTALRILASMKRDWMQTGRKPSGICGAALYIASLSHGHMYTKAQIIKVVHICEATLTKRLIEFENTESGGLTIKEFNDRAENEIGKEKDMPVKSGIGELLCEHKDSGTHFAHGLCKICYEEFLELSGGLEGGSEPPAFQKAETERLMAKEDSILNYCSEPTVQESQIEEEHESLSDIDDSEVEGYLHNEEEKKFKKIIWEELNKEYVEEQKAKEAAELAKTKAEEALYSNCSEEVKAALKLAADAAAAAAKTRKEKQQKRAAELKSMGPAQSAAEATRQMLDRKRLSSKIRYDVLEKLFEEDGEVEDSTKKKARIETESNHDGEDLDNNGEDVYYNENVEEFDYGDDYSHFDEY